MKKLIAKIALGIILLPSALMGCADQATEDGKKFRQYMCAYEQSQEITIDEMVGRKPSNREKAARINEWLKSHPYGMIQARYLMGQATSQEAERFQKAYNETKCPSFD